jgi:hypothetical protein
MKARWVGAVTGLVILTTVISAQEPRPLDVLEAERKARADAAAQGAGSGDCKPGAGGVVLLGVRSAMVGGAVGQLRPGHPLLVAKEQNDQQMKPHVARATELSQQIKTLEKKIADDEQSLAHFAGLLEQAKRAGNKDAERSAAAEVAKLRAQVQAAKGSLSQARIDRATTAQSLAALQAVGAGLEQQAEAIVAKCG